jgi:GLPGLI family protein
MKHIKIGNPNKNFKQMKQIIITALFLLNVLISFGQERRLYSAIHYPMGRDVFKFTVADTCSIRVWYTMNAEEKQTDKNTYYDDLQILEIGNHVSKYYSYLVFKSDSLAALANKNRKASLLRGGFENDCSPSWAEYFKDYKKGIFTEYLRGPQYIANHCYSETIPVQNWELSDDTLRVAGYLCQNATCSFRGRNYTAWFTSDIPVSHGPWKFGGLPGLILKVYDEKKEFVFECTGLEHNSKSVIKFFGYENYARITRERLLKLMKAIDKDYYTAAGMRGPYVSKDAGFRNHKPQYNTMLLELE